MNKNNLIEGEKAALHGMLHLIALGVIKMTAGLITGMTVIIADAISTFADVLGLFASYMGLHLSQKTADKKFEYGYYKIETFAALLVSIGIIYLGYVILRDSVPTFFSPTAGEFRSLAITTTVIAIIHSARLGQALTVAGKKVNSLSLLANARDKKLDVIAGGGVLLSIIANYQGIPYVEGVVTSIIALVILSGGLTSAKESLFFLLDYWDDPKLYKKIQAVFSKEKDIVTEVKKLRLRRAGTFIFGEAFIEINPFSGIQDLREEIELLSQKIEDLDPYIKDFVIYSHIPDSKNVKIAVPIKKGTTLEASVASTIKETSAYLFADIKKGKISDFYVKPLKKEQKKPVELANFLKAEKVNILIDNKLNSILYYNLRRTHHILIYPNFSDIKRVKDTITLLLIDT